MPKSWIRTSSSSAAFRTRRQGSLRSVRCAALGGPNYDMGIALDALGRGQNFQPGDRHRLGAPSQGLSEVCLTVERVLDLINPILRGWVKYFRVGMASRCFSHIKDWVEKKIRRHLMHQRGRRGFGWKRWSRRWLYERLGLFS